MNNTINHIKLIIKKTLIVTIVLLVFGCSKDASQSKKPSVNSNKTVTLEKSYFNDGTSLFAGAEDKHGNFYFPVELNMASLNVNSNEIQLFSFEHGTLQDKWANTSPLIQTANGRVISLYLFDSNNPFGDYDQRMYEVESNMFKELIFDEDLPSRKDWNNAPVNLIESKFGISCLGHAFHTYNGMITRYYETLSKYNATLAQVIQSRAAIFSKKYGFIYGDQDNDLIIGDLSNNPKYPQFNGTKFNLSDRKITQIHLNNEKAYLLAYYTGIYELDLNTLKITLHNYANLPFGWDFNGNHAVRNLNDFIKTDSRGGYWFFQNDHFVYFNGTSNLRHEIPTDIFSSIYREGNNLAVFSWNILSTGDIVMLFADKNEQYKIVRFRPVI